MPIRYARVLLAGLISFCFLFFSAFFSGALVPSAGAVQVELPSVGLPGVNDPECRSETRPRPVVLVHGTFGTAADHFGALAPMLREEGYCVYALDYGDNATARVAESARELAAFVDDVLAATGADQVDAVGYSQGGMMPRQYLKFEGGAGKVGGLVGIAPSNHGTGGGFFQGPLCLSCLDQLAGSSFMRALNSGGDIITEGEGASLRYTTIATRHDLVVIPYTSQALNGPPDRVTNLVLQDLCPDNTASHTSIRSDPVTLQLVLNALDHRGLADPTFQPEC
jgi:triacylglycerol esterase/lipase EstA (alpha/beta hydrolase family)